MRSLPSPACVICTGERNPDTNGVNASCGHITSVGEAVGLGGLAVAGAGDAAGVGRATASVASVGETTTVGDTVGPKIAVTDAAALAAGVETAVEVGAGS
jgi:hypothetical protein